MTTVVLFVGLQLGADQHGLDGEQGHSLLLVRARRGVAIEELRIQREARGTYLML